MRKKFVKILLVFCFWQSQTGALIAASFKDSALRANALEGIFASRKAAKAGFLGKRTKSAKGSLAGLSLRETQQLISNLEQRQKELEQSPRAIQDIELVLEGQITGDLAGSRLDPQVINREIDFWVDLSEFFANRVDRLSRFLDPDRTSVERGELGYISVHLQMMEVVYPELGMINSVADPRLSEACLRVAELYRLYSKNTQYKNQAGLLEPFYEATALDLELTYQKCLAVSGDGAAQIIARASGLPQGYAHQAYDFYAMALRESLGIIEHFHQKMDFLGRNPSFAQILNSGLLGEEQASLKSEQDLIQETSNFLKKWEVPLVSYYSEEKQIGR